MNAKNARTPTLVISLDFELHWGVRDHLSLEQYRENLLGARQAVPAMLELFASYGIHATWATVGFLFRENREQLLQSMPANLPAYEDRECSPYADVHTVGADETDDPYHFAASLIRMIVSAPYQEIGTHTFSHYFCLEPGADTISFRDDLNCAHRAAQPFGAHLRSLVFARNQYNAEFIAVCREQGIQAYRGTEHSWIYAGRSRRHETWLRRALRLFDSYMNVTGHNCFVLDNSNANMPLNVPSSRFLRPYSRRLRGLEGLRLRRILNGMSYAANSGMVFHLWWHPHNFGVNLQENLAFLRKILQNFQQLREQYDMQSLNMGELADRISNGRDGSAVA